MSDLPGADAVVQGAIATGVIGLLVKELVSTLRNRNGAGHVTREAFAEAQADLKADLNARITSAQTELKDHIDLKAGHLDEKIEKLDESFFEFRKAQHLRWDRINPLPATVQTLERRVERLEDKPR